MKAMILAAGRGERMMPLTATCPKPLLKVDRKPLIQHQIEKLAAASITEIIINTSYLGEQIQTFLGDGSQFNASITFSQEDEILETGGGIEKILPFMEGQPFVVVNGDVWTDLDYQQMQRYCLSSDKAAHLILIDNPAHNSVGDFSISADNLLLEPNGETYTYSGLGIFSEKLFAGYLKSSAKYPLLPLLKRGIQNKTITAEHYSGFWMDVGTPERLAQLETYLAFNKKKKN